MLDLRSEQGAGKYMHGPRRRSNWVLMHIIGSKLALKPCTRAAERRDVNWHNLSLASSSSAEAGMERGERLLYVTQLCFSVYIIVVGQLSETY